jgi:hypothetical protein
MIEKRLLVPHRLRRPPATGWSWIDRRFLREHGDHLSREAILLYLFLAAVADKHGLSFCSDNTLSSRLQLPLPVLEKARQELLERDLIAYQLPLVQVLSVASPGVRRRAEPGQGLMMLGDIFRQAGFPAAAPQGQTVSAVEQGARVPTPQAPTPQSRRTTP